MCLEMYGSLFLPRNKNIKFFLHFFNFQILNLFLQNSEFPSHNSDLIFFSEFTFTFTFIHLADAFIQSDLQLGNSSSDSS